MYDVSFLIMHAEYRENIFMAAHRASVPVGGLVRGRGGHTHRHRDPDPRPLSTEAEQGGTPQQHLGCRETELV